MIQKLDPMQNASEEFKRPGLSYEQGRYAGFEPLFSGNKEATLRAADWNWLTLHFSPLQSAIQAGTPLSGVFNSVTTANLILTNMTQGSALFVGAGGVVTQSNPFFFFDNTNSRLGLATTTPSVTLDVNGDIRDRNMTPGSVLFAGTGGVISQNNASLFWDTTNTRLTVGAAWLYTPGGTGNLFLGLNSGNLTTTSTFSTGLGSRTLQSITSGAFEVCIGHLAGNSITTSPTNVFVGVQAGQNTSTGVGKNTACGTQAYQNNRTGDSCDAFGANALFTATGSTQNCAMGGSGLYLTTGNNNTSCGFQAGAQNTTGSNNSYFGNSSGSTGASSTSLTYSAAIGAGSLVGASSTMALGGTGSAAVRVCINQTTANARLDVLDASGIQLQLTQSASIFAGFQVAATTGNLYITPQGGTTNLVGINQSAAAARLDILDASGAQLRLTQTAASIYTNFTVAATTGNLTITPTGGTTNQVGIPTGTAALPSLFFAINSHTGYSATAVNGSIQVSLSGSAFFCFDREGAVNQFTMAGSALAWSSGSGVYGNSADLWLKRDGAGILALKDTVNNTGQTFRIYAGNGGNSGIVTVNESLTIAAAATTDSATTIPANAIILSVAVRVTTVIPTAATFTVTATTGGNTFDTAAVSTAAGSTDPGTAAGALYTAAGTKVRITPNLQPAAATGVVRLAITYYLSTPPTS